MGWTKWIGRILEIAMTVFTLGRNNKWWKDTGGIPNTPRMRRFHR